jgi:hypothetical protein
LFDEHAGYSAVSAAFARKANLAPPGADGVQTLAAGEIREGHLTAVKKLQLMGAFLADARVLVLDALPEGVDGVIGLNFLMQFSVRHTSKGVSLAPLVFSTMSSQSE